MIKNRVRIIGGEWRSRIISFPARKALRPTPDRVRETLFNWLGQDLSGKSCLDLFAGSGALGFEAASRGASEVVMVESDPEVCRALEANARALGARQTAVLCQDALAFLARNRRQFDVIFLDPPYRGGALAECLARAAPHLCDNGVLYAESNEQHALSADWQVLRAGRAGRVRYLLAALRTRRTRGDEL